MMTKTTVHAEWTGNFPNLCSGEWKLNVNGVDVSDKIPECLRNSPMNTFGTYSTWHFDDDYDEVWEDYEDGLEEIDWIKRNNSWLSNISPDETVWSNIYYAFQSCDWRHLSCGGCT